MILLRRRLRASPEEVWGAFADAGSLARWLHCQADGTALAENDFREGGRWRVQMLRAGRACGEAHGRWLELRPHSFLSFSWSAPTVGVEDSRVSVRLAPRGAWTELELHHELSAESPEGARHQQGWRRSLEHLALHVETQMAEALVVAQQWHAAWSSGRVAEARALLHPALEVDVPINAYAGPDSFMAAVEGFGAMLTQVTLLSALGADDEAMLLYDVEAPGLGTLRVAEHFRVRDGLITSVRQVHDTAPIRALGLGA